VLKATGEPMHVKAIVEAAAKRGLWKSNAATPHATLYAAMIREIAAKGKAARFARRNMQRD